MNAWAWVIVGLVVAIILIIAVLMILRSRRRGSVLAASASKGERR